MLTGSTAKRRRPEVEEEHDEQESIVESPSPAGRIKTKASSAKRKRIETNNNGSDPRKSPKGGSNLPDPSDFANPAHSGEQAEEQDQEENGAQSGDSGWWRRFFLLRNHYRDHRDQPISDSLISFAAEQQRLFRLLFLTEMTDEVIEELHSLCPDIAVLEEKFAALQSIQFDWVKNVLDLPIYRDQRALHDKYYKHRVALMDLLGYEYERRSDGLGRWIKVRDPDPRAPFARRPALHEPGDEELEKPEYDVKLIQQEMRVECRQFEDLFGKCKKDCPYNLARLRRWKACQLGQISHSDYFTEDCYAGHWYLVDPFYKWKTISDIMDRDDRVAEFICWTHDSCPNCYPLLKIKIDKDTQKSQGRLKNREAAIKKEISELVLADSAYFKEDSDSTSPYEFVSLGVYKSKESLQICKERHLAKMDQTKGRK